MLMRARLWITNVIARNRFEDELADEVAFHIQARAEHWERQGLTPAEAGRRARLEFGSVEKCTEEVRDVRLGAWIQQLRQDVRYGVRMLAKHRGFTTAAVLSLALGIGATTAIFSVVNAVLLRDLPFADPEQLYALRTATTDGRLTGRQVTPREIASLNDNHPAVQVAALTQRVETPVMDGDGTRTLRVRTNVTEKFFELFGVSMMLGRAFTPEDDPRVSPTVMSYSMWRDNFGSDPSVLGVSRILGMPLITVVGVAPEAFDFPRGTDLWTMARFRAPGYYDLRAFDGYVRLRAETSLQQARAALGVLAEELGREYVGSNADRVFVLQPLLEAVVGDLGPTLVILFGATAILLLIACMSVTALLLSRGAIRAKEIALRLAVGAGRARIVRQLLTEGLVLSAVGGALGLAVGVVGVRLLLRLAPSSFPRLADVGIDSGVLLFAVGSTLLTGLLVGLTPGLRLAKTDIRSVVNDGGHGSTAGLGRGRIFDILVVGEVGLAVLLVIGAGLLVLSYSNLTNTDPGFESERRLVFELDVSGRRIDRETGLLPIAIFYRELLDRIRSIGGVEAVAATSTLPIGNQRDRLQPLSVVGDSPPEPGQAPREWVRQVTSDFFPTMGIRVVAGRGFAATDRRGAPGVAVVNEAFARRFFPGENPLGQRVNLLAEMFRRGGVGFSWLGEQSVDQVEVVGVVADVKYASLSQPAEASLYLSHEQATFRRMTVVVRTALDAPQNLIPAVRREISAMDPVWPVEVHLYPEVVRASIVRERLGMMLLVVFGAAALLLAAVGVYGVISASVTQRRGEIAVRAALGASAAQVLRLIMQHGVQLALVGVAAGVIGAVALRQILASQLYEISALDLRVLLLVPVALLVVALLASFLPARRATKIDPAVLLRTE